MSRHRAVIHAAAALPARVIRALDGYVHLNRTWRCAWSMSQR
jgi:hypothetical protein